MRTETDPTASAATDGAEAVATARPAAAPGRQPAPVRRPVSLALRLTVSIGLAISVLFLALGWVIERAVDHHFVEQDADELAVVAQSLQQVLQRPAGPEAAADAAARLGRAVQGHHGMHWFVADAQGRPVYAMDGPDLAAVATRHPALPAVDADRLLEWAEAGQRYRGAVLQLAAGPGAPAWTAVVATDVGFHDHFLHGFRRAVWAATSVAGLLAIGLTWLAVHRGHAPLRRISAQISGVSASALHVRLDPAAVPIELQELAVSFNTMLERVEQDFRRLSHFSADIAHELRTPVTNLVTQTQVLLSRPRSTDDYREALYSSLEEYERMSAMVSDMLYLAQTDHQLIRPAHEPVDLAAEVQALFEFFEPWAEERQVRLALDDQAARATAAADGPPAARGDRLMLRRALSNLLANAIRHTPAGRAVTVTLRRDARGAAQLQVANPGEPIAAEHLPHLFDRFYRVDPSRQRKGDGAGLGLAIVKAIAEAHGGQVAADSGPAGTVFTVVLPAP